MSRVPVHQLAGSDILDQLWGELPPYALEFMDQTFTQHDEEAASRLVSAAPNERADIALCAYWLGIPNPAYRAIVGGVWDHDHWQLLNAVGQDTLMIREIFAAGEFPHSLRGNQTVYRGAINVEPETAVEGLSWTTSHEIACWFACRHSGAAPVVLTAAVSSSEIIYWSNERNECEVILRSAPPLRLDDQPNRWDEIARSVSEERALKSRLALASRLAKL